MGSFIKLIMNVKEKDDESKAIMEALKELGNIDVLVGIPEGGEVKESGVSVAQLLHIHTNGSAVKNIPPRPVIEPAIEDGKAEIAEMLKQAADKALKGDLAGAMQEIEKTGMRGEGMAKKWFYNKVNGWEENKQITKERKKSNRPLIDTGGLRGSITYVVRKK